MSTSHRPYGIAAALWCARRLLAPRWVASVLLTHGAYVIVSPPHCRTGAGSQISLYSTRPHVLVNISESNELIGVAVVAVHVGGLHAVVDVWRVRVGPDTVGEERQRSDEH